MSTETTTPASETKPAKVNKALETIKARVANDFAYHAPKAPVIADLHGQIRAKHKELADFVLANIPQGREQANCITKIEESMFWANAGIARMQDYLLKETPPAT